jgi:hypothetical protein
MRAALSLVLLTGCLESEPGGRFEARLTYDGTRTTATVTFPPYSRSTDQPAVVVGTVTGDAPITNARIDHGEVRTYTLQLARNADDMGAGPVQCVLLDADIGHATACTGTRKSCSIVMEALP